MTGAPGPRSSAADADQPKSVAYPDPATAEDSPLSRRGWVAALAALASVNGPFIGSFAFRGLGLLLGFGVNVLLARLLGASEFGVYTLAFAVIALLAVPMHDGVANLLMREVARDTAASAWGNLRGDLLAANLFIVIGAVAAVVIVAPVVWTQVPAAGRVLWWLALALLPLYALANLRGAALLGLARPVLAQIPDLILRPALLGLALLIGGGLAQWRIAADRAMAFHLGAALCAFLVGTALMLRALPRQIHGAAPVYRMRAWMRSLGPFALISGVQVTNSSLAVLLLGYFTTSPEISAYRVAFLGSSLLVIGMVAGGQVLSPQIAALHARGERTELQRRIRTMTRIMLATALPPALLLLVFSHPLIQFVFGEQYVRAQWPIVILIIGQLINVGTGAVGVLLIMTGHELSALRTLIGTTLLNLVLGLVLIPPLGALGAAIATAAAMAVSNLRMAWQARALLGVRSTPW
jgi:O-antigen/teichoic acid export membrane protein